MLLPTCQQHLSKSPFSPTLTLPPRAAAAHPPRRLCLRLALQHSVAVCLDAGHPQGHNLTRLIQQLPHLQGQRQR